MRKHYVVHEASESLYMRIKWGFNTFYIRCWLRLLQCSQLYHHALNLSLCCILKVLIVTVIVNQLTKQMIFISTHNTIVFMDLTCLFVLHVFFKYGISSHVTSDRDSEFVSNFFCSLGIALDMWLYFTLDYHSEGDGQTEYTNQTLKQYLHIYCNYQQDNWSKLLSLIEFAYNNALSATTSIFPFFANKKYYPNNTVHPEYEIVFFRACDFTIDLS